MAHTRPGTYVLYREAISEQSLYPAIVYTDDLAPIGIQRSRPLSARWATTGQLSSLSFIEEAGYAMQSEKEVEAYEMAKFWGGTGFGLSHWHSEVEAQVKMHGWKTLVDHASEWSIKPVEIVEDDDYEEGDDEEDDEDMREAMRLSREEASYGTMHSHLATPSASPPGASLPRKRSELIIIDDGDSDDSLYKRPSKKSRSRRSSERSHHSHNRHRANFFSPTTSDEEGSLKTRAKGNRHKKQQESRSRFSGAKGLDQLLGRSSLGRPIAAPTSDTIEGRISKSKDFIQVPVGSEGEIRTFPKKNVWNRPYFQDSRTGINHFRLNGDNIWELRHPHLAHIELEDFQFIAEYLTDGEFGLRNPEGPDQNKEAIAQCVSAWETAEKLSMDDMLEHIAEKVKFLEWDNEDVLTLAILVYRTSGPSLPPHEMMKDWISGFLAHHFWAYVKDETIGHYFRKRLRRLPELERDVFEKRATSLRTGADPDEDVESDEGGLDDDEL